MVIFKNSLEKNIKTIIISNIIVIYLTQLLHQKKFKCIIIHLK